MRSSDGAKTVTKLVAEAEIAAALGKRLHARTLVAAALALDPASDRCRKLFQELEVPRRLHRVKRSKRPISGRQIAALRDAEWPSLTDSEVETIVEALLECGRRRTRATRRLGRRSIAAGAVLVRHHARPDVGLIVRGGEVQAVVTRQQRADR